MRYIPFLNVRVKLDAKTFPEETWRSHESQFRRLVPSFTPKDCQNARNKKSACTTTINRRRPATTYSGVLHRLPPRAATANACVVFSGPISSWPVTATLPEQDPASGAHNVANLLPKI